MSRSGTPSTAQIARTGSGPASADMTSNSRRAIASSSSSSVIASSRPRRRSTAAGVNTELTRRRSRVWSGPSMPIIDSAPMGSMRPVRSGELNSHRMNAGVPAVNESRVALADTTLGCRSTAEHISWEVVMTPRSARTTRPCSRSQS